MRVSWTSVAGGSLVLALGVAGLVRGAMPQSTGASAPTVSAAGPIAVTNAYIVAPVPPTEIAAAYFTVYNTTAVPDKLVSVVSGAGALSVLHVETSNGNMVMAEDGLTIPAHGSLVLRVGQDHVMIEKLYGQVKPGQTVDLDLQFQNAGSIDVVAPVIKVGTTPPTGSATSAPPSGQSSSSATPVPSGAHS
jgi:periplasmic copper chaperone A